MPIDRIPSPIVPMAQLNAKESTDSQNAAAKGNIKSLIEKFDGKSSVSSVRAETSKFNSKSDLVHHSQLEIQAERAETFGGIVKAHSLDLQAFCTKENTCLCIRGVNPFSTDLIREGFGTKDMSIKAKSSNLPPLNALIPVKQDYGKKGADPEAAAAFTQKNYEAREKKTATFVDAEISANRLGMLVEETGRLEIHGTWLQADSGEGLMIGTDFISKDAPDGKQFPFWGVKDGESIKLFEAIKVGGSWQKGDPVQVMGNREGRAVTADYDLAINAPHMSDYDSQHTPALKVGSFEEAVSLGIHQADDTEARAAFYNVDVSEALRRGSEEYEAVPALDGQDSNFLQVDYPALRRASLETISSHASAEELQEIAADTAYVDELTRLNIEENRASLVEQGLLPQAGPMRSLGIASDYEKKLIPQLNAALGREKGQEVFHHGADSGNPWSVEADNYPMTAILPDSMRFAGDNIVLIKNADAFLELVQHLKNNGYHVPINHRWSENAELVNVRSKSFIEAKTSLEQHFLKA